MSAFLRILAAQARRDRWVLTIWILGIAALGLAAANAISSEFAEEAERAAIVAVAAANPAFLFLRGLPDGTSVGVVAFFQAFSFTAVLAGLMSTFLVARHTRADEEQGRGELVQSTPVRRASPLLATVALGVIANVVLAALVAAGYAASGLPIEGSVMTGLATGSTGLVFVGVGALVAQAAPTGRATNGIAAAAVGVAYLVRGVGDALGTPSDDLTRVVPSALSWASPIGWAQATRPFAEPTPLPLALSLATFALLTLAAVLVRARRDLGSSILPESAGRASAGFGGRSVLGLAWRLQHGTLLGWSIGAAVLGAIAGALAPVVADAVAGNDSLAQLIASLSPGTEADTAAVFTTAILGMTGVLAAASGVQAVLRLRSEEQEGRAELLLSTPTSRWVWAGSTMFIAAISVFAVCLVGGVATGALLVASGNPEALGEYAAAGLAHAPAALVFVALTGLVFAALPRLTVAVGWSILVVGLVLGQFGELLDLPEWAQDISPFRHSSAVPVEAFDAGAAAALVAIAVGGVILALAVLRRRSLVT
ncbi:ABC-2 type transport system permease protein [Microbacteriaceae bacterium SG_E_30_P1]|uniref:ABC-2 type transport system permease protein n=1 Tax=Antiquaquibacter oligotrophicus TaxID=2880260 RepID=A0ABT6KQ68_9MICO|nr:polyketide antibiotic transporter [Antiquaquibacter oligotrophicus]MDH6182118.1 ABC-2 type transport system permease protein [Antiquaquibacter oligotrophicus]UDF12219.1 polyketide antibiotic transporter [Antiquaquibacter oligotrophicus]